MNSSLTGTGGARPSDVRRERARRSARSPRAVSRASAGRLSPKSGGTSVLALAAATISGPREEAAVRGSRGCPCCPQGRSAYQCLQSSGSEETGPSAASGGGCFQLLGPAPASPVVPGAPGTAAAAMGLTVGTVLFWGV